MPSRQQQQHRQLAADAGFAGFDCGSGLRITWNRPNSGKPYLLHNNFNHRLSLNDVYSDSPFMPSIPATPISSPADHCSTNDRRRFRADLFGESHGCPPVRPSGQLPREEREEASLLGRKRLKFVIGFFKRKIPRKSLQSSISFALRCVQ